MYQIYFNNPFLIISILIYCYYVIAQDFGAFMVMIVWQSVVVGYATTYAMNVAS